MNELSEIQQYTLAKFQLLPFTYFSAEELAIIFNENDITQLYDTLSVLSKGKYIVKKNKKFAPKQLKKKLIENFKLSDLKFFNKYISFLQVSLSFNSNQLLKKKELFSKLAQNYFELFSPKWESLEIELLYETLTYFYRSGQNSKAAFLFNKYNNEINTEDNEKFEFILNISKTIQLKNKAKYKEALENHQINEKYIEKCKNVDLITQYYLLYFYLLRLNSLQSNSLTKYEKAKNRLKELDATQLYRDRLKFGKANILLDLNEAKPAIDTLIEVIDSQLKYLNNVHPHLAECYSALGTAYHFIGNTELAIQYSLTSLEILNFNYENESFEKNSIRFTLASAYLASENYGLARKQIEITLDSSHRLSKKYHPDHSIYRSMDILLQKTKYEHPIDEMMKDFKKVKKYFPKNHSIIGFFHNNLAMLYAENEEFKESNKHLLAAYKINFDLYNKETVNQAMLLSNIAINLEAMEEYDEALSLLKRAEKILSKQLGKNHPDLAKIYQAFAQIYTHKENYNKALNFLSNAKRIIKYYNEEHPSLVSIYSNMGINYQSIGKYKKAKSLSLKAYELYEAFYPEKSSFMEVKLLNTLASIQRKISDDTPQGEYSKKALRKLNEVWSELLINDEMLSMAYSTCDNLFYDGEYKDSKILADRLDNSLQLANMVDLTLSAKTKAGILNTIAMNAAYNNEKHYAINALFKAIHILEREKNIQTNYISNFYSTLVDLLISSSYHKEYAIPYLQKLIKIEQSKLDKVDNIQLVKYIRNLGSVYMAIKKFELAAIQYNFAIKICLEDKQLEHFIFSIYLELAHAHSGLGEMNKEIDYSLRALHAYYQTDNQSIETESSIILQLATSYSNNAQYNQAILYAHQAEQKLLNKTNNNLSLINTYSILSSLHNDVGDKPSSEFYTRKVEVLLETSQIPQNSLFNWIHKYKIARHYAANKQFKKAIQISESIINAMNKIDFFNDLYIDLSQFIIEIKELIDEMD